MIGGTNVGDSHSKSANPVEKNILLVILPAGNSKHQLRPIVVAANLKIFYQKHNIIWLSQASMMKIGQHLNKTSLGSERPLVLLPCLDSLSSSRLKVGDCKI